MAIILIKQADYLLFKQLQKLAGTFLAEGGFTERMYTLRTHRRKE